mmetsp:Transcript_12864/g.34639  ORF Transcript_12864/g.34639 Transcript_12864/m.34639 type:complete len:244 (-) Transcript_12864:492-1223(-)
MRRGRAVIQDKAVIAAFVGIFAIVCERLERDAMTRARHPDGAGQIPTQKVSVIAHNKRGVLPAQAKKSRMIFAQKVHGCVHIDGPAEGALRVENLDRHRRERASTLTQLPSPARPSHSSSGWEKRSMSASPTEFYRTFALCQLPQRTKCAILSLRVCEVCFCNQRVRHPANFALGKPQVQARVLSEAIDAAYFNHRLHVGVPCEQDQHERAVLCGKVNNETTHVRRNHAGGYWEYRVGRFHVE